LNAFVPSAHAPLSPSSATRWINCPGSIEASKGVPPAPSSPYADEGSRVHEAFARCLLEGRTAADVIADPYLAVPLQEALDHTRRIIAGRAVLIEQRLHPIDDMPEVWGTADVLVFDPPRRLSAVIDLKFGSNILVEANALQLGVYGLLGARRFGLSQDGLTTWIVQPRCAHPEGPARSHHYDIPALRALLSTLRAAAMATRRQGAARIPGPWCRFCPAWPVCPERQAVPRTPSAFSHV